MPNLEFHGFPQHDKLFLLSSIKSVIPDALKAEIVVTFVPSEVTDLEGNPQPFLRIYDTEDRPDLKKAIKSLKFDTEYLLLQGFVPAG